jgi:serine/threonine-protein kinase
MSTPAESTPGGPKGGPAKSATGAEALIGVTISDRYRIDKLLGEGGMGAVYQAEHAHMRKRVAVKVLHPEMSRMAEVVARFEREAMAASHIDHPNVATATDYGKLEDGSFFLVLEFIEGQSLRDVIAKGPLKWRRALHITRQISAGLARAHALGIVHRDLKPENVMLVDKEGDPDFVKVLDFGIAKVPVGDMSPGSKSGPVLTQLGMVYGTPEYMAPEQALGQEVDLRADLYSVGVMLYEMLAGVRPYEHESKVTLLGMHVTAKIPKVSDKAPDVTVPAEVDAIVETLLAKEAKKRYPSAKELQEAIEHVIGKPTMPPPPPPRASAAALSHVDGMLSRFEATLPLDRVPLPTTPRNKLYAIAGALALVLFVGALAFILLLRVVFGGRDDTTTVPSASASTSGAPLATGAPIAPRNLTAEDIAALDQRAQKGEAVTVLPTLEAFAKQHADRADVHRALCHAYIATSDKAAMLREAIAWASLDAATFDDDDKVSAALRGAALDKDLQEQAFDALETKLDTTGPDVLWDLAYGTSPSAPPVPQARARKSLAKPEVRKKTSPALAVTLDIKNASSICDAKTKSFPEAKRVGDARTISVLSQYQNPRGCGFLKMSDCWPCLRGGDDSVAKTIAAIQARSGK